MTPAVHEMCERLRQLNHQYETAPDEGARNFALLLMQGALQDAKELADQVQSLERSLAR